MYAATAPQERHHVVVIGSGFGGLAATRGLAGADVEVTVIDRDNYHGFWPLLYQVATAGLGPDDIASALRGIIGQQPNVRVRLGTVSRVDLDGRVVHVDEDARSDDGADHAVPYDSLVVAAGSSTTDFGISGVADHAFPLKTLPDAMRLRNHVLATFEHADADPDIVDEGALTMVVVGGGSTGVEMAGALSELIAANLKRDFPDLDTHRSSVVLVEMTDHLLEGFSARSQRTALDVLRAKGVEVRFGTTVDEVGDGWVRFEDGSRISTKTLVWTAGIRANPLADSFPGEKGKGGSLVVGPDLSLPGHPEVFVIGDLASAKDRRGNPLPQLAQVAIQGGHHAARSIERRLAGRIPAPFRYRNHGTMATIGRKDAVAELPGGLKLSGTLGWLAWLGVHLVFLVGSRNRLVVMTNWAWNYLTWDRANRVIIED